LHRSLALLLDLDVEPAFKTLRHVLDSLVTGGVLDIEHFGALASIENRSFRVELFADAGVALGDRLGIGVDLVQSLRVSLSAVTDPQKREERTTQ
jgi:hypothetical protein